MRLREEEVIGGGRKWRGEMLREGEDAKEEFGKEEKEKERRESRDDDAMAWARKGRGRRRHSQPAKAQQSQ